MESFFIILLIILGVLSLIRILATFICSLINHGNDGYLGIKSLQSFDYRFNRFDGGFYILPTIKCYNLKPTKYLEFSLCWLWFEYYKCYYLEYENE